MQVDVTHVFIYGFLVSLRIYDLVFLNWALFTYARTGDQIAVRSVIFLYHQVCCLISLTFRLKSVWVCLCLIVLMALERE